VKSAAPPDRLFNSAAPAQGATAGGEWPLKSAAGRPISRAVDRLRIPKHRAELEVTSPDGEARSFSVFLAECTTHGGPERVCDLLNGPREFLPAIDCKTDATIFLARSSIAVARVEGPLWDVDELNLPIEHEVEVVLTSGRVIAGLISYVLPNENSRVVDYLNDPAPFLAVVEGERVALVNKRYVQSVALAKVGLKT